MPTYGEKWRAVSSACETGHVPRSCPTTFLRLDSTGEISSVGKGGQPNKKQFGSTSSREINGNMINMKNWVASSVLGFNGLRSASNFTNSGKNNTNSDYNGNILDRIADSVPAVQSMNPNMPKCRNKYFPPPNGVIPGWNYYGQGFGVVNDRMPVFPCHQFNSFGTTPGVFQHQGTMFTGADYLKIMGQLTQSQMLDDHQWHQRHRKYDRPSRGHIPKHHKHDQVKHEKKTFPADQVASKYRGKGESEKNSTTSTSKGNLCSEDKKFKRTQPQCSKSKQSKVVDSIKSSTQVKPDVAESSVLPDCDGENSPRNGSSTVCTELQTRDLDSTDSDSKINLCKMGPGTVNMIKSDETPYTCNKEASSRKTECPDQNYNSQMLCVRKNWKKGRPSSSKQRRRKLQKAKSSNCESSNISSETGEKLVCEDRETCSPVDENQWRCNRKISFSPATPDSSSCSPYRSSFVLSISDQDDDDEDDDFEIDCVNNAEWQAHFTDFAQCDLFNFLPQNKTSSPLSCEDQFSPLQNENTQVKSIADINSSWNVQISHGKKPKHKKKTSKQVHFPEDKDLSVVYPMVAWSYAYNEARKGHWENFVRDRDRFKRRVEELERILNPVMDSRHRDLIYEKRFQAL